MPDKGNYSYENISLPRWEGSHGNIIWCRGHLNINVIKIAKIFITNYFTLQRLVHPLILLNVKILNKLHSFTASFNTWPDNLSFFLLYTVYTFIPSPPPLCITLPIASYVSKKTIKDIRMWLFLNLPGHNEKDFIALGIIKVDSNSTQRLKITLIF